MKLFVIVACMVSVSLNAQPIDFTSIDKMLQDSARAIGGLQGKSSTVFVDRAGIVHVRSTGAFGADSVVPIASSSKWMSGAVIMSLVDKGSLSLDDTCGKFLPSFTGAKASITIRQLMSHTSGFPGNSKYESDRTLTLAQAVDSIGMRIDLVGTPGAGFRYGGVSMQVAGRIAEIVSGVSWDTLFTRTIARPLGMLRTNYDGFGPTDNPMIAGGARSCANDYAQFLNMLLRDGEVAGQRILSEEAIQTMCADQTRGATIVSSPFDAFASIDPSMAASKYGIGNWVETPSIPFGVINDNSSLGAFGFSPWIDRNRKIGGAIVVRSSTQNVAPTYFAVKKHLRTAIDTMATPSTYVVTVENGYGSGSFSPGDTVHVFARAMSADEVFGEWLNTANLVVEGRTEWHATFVMPTADVKVTATYRSIPPFTLRYETIQGVERAKNVYSYFPPATRGVVLLYHGTGGSARGWLPTSADNYMLVKDLIADSFAVIVTESEETTLNEDLNGDGKIRWYVSAPVMDSSIDYRNLRAIIDTMIGRGVMSAATPLFGIGMSNGGAFSIPAGVVLGMRAAVSYCAQGRQTQMLTITMPVMWCMAQNDDNEQVGPTGNANALENSGTLERRGIDTRYLLHGPYPIVPEHFVRFGASVLASQKMVTELDTNGCLDERRMLRFTSDSISAIIQADPTRFPFLVTQSQLSILQLRDALSVAYAGHHFFADLDRATIDFLKRHIGPSSDVRDTETMHVQIVPQPASDHVSILSDAPVSSVSISDITGRVLISIDHPQSAERLATSHLSAGTYFVRATTSTTSIIRLLQIVR
jgi:CubicO group peptidase (beta-lactamase class C family)